MSIKSAIFMIAITTTAMAGYINLDTMRQSDALPTALVIAGASVGIPTLEKAAQVGWRECEPVTVPEGYVMLSCSWVQDTNEPLKAMAVLVTRTVAEQAAINAVAASNAAYRKSLPVQMPTGIEGPVVVLTNDTGSAWGIVVDDGDLIIYPDHASPRPPVDVIASRIATAKVERAEMRQDLRAIKAAISNNIEQTGAIVSAGISDAVARSAIVGLRRELVDAQQELNKLRRVVAQMSKGD